MRARAHRCRMSACACCCSSACCAPLSAEQVAALKRMHAQKVRALMRSIDSLKQELDTAKQEARESHRSAVIQQLRGQVREAELVADVLKRKLVDSAGMSEEEVRPSPPLRPSPLAHRRHPPACR